MTCRCCGDKSVERCPCYVTPLCACGRCWLCCACRDNGLVQMMAQRRAKQMVTDRHHRLTRASHRSARADRLAAVMG